MAAGPLGKTPAPKCHRPGQCGRTETLLNAPRFDFNWQHRYVLAKPRHLPAGTLIHCTAVYDNTAANPNNPDLNAIVKAGPQSTDEMFQACFEVADTEPPSKMPVLWLLGAALAVTLIWRRSRS